MRSLVTGGAGFVGRHLIRHLQDCGDTVLACDVNRPSSPLPVSFEQMDIVKSDAVANVLSSFRPDIIYHLAGMAFVPDAEGNFDAALKANVLGTSVICRTAHLLGITSRILFVSSAEVYGKVMPNRLPIDEQVPVQPMNNYSLSKAMAELVVQRYERSGGPAGVIVRPFNHIGPGQNDRFVASAFARQLAQIASGKAPPVVEVGNLEAQRDFSDVRDIVRAYRLAGMKGQGIYNLCAGRGYAIQTLLDQLIEISGLKVSVRQDPARMRGPEVPVMYGSYEKASKELGWTPSIDLKQTLEEIYDYWLSEMKKA